MKSKYDRIDSTSSPSPFHLKGLEIRFVLDYFNEGLAYKYIMKMMNQLFLNQQQFNLTMTGQPTNQLANNHSKRP
jgi:hypothetical protein